MLVAIPEVPETTHPQSPITTTITSTTTTTTPTTATPHQLLHNNNNNLLHAAKSPGALQGVEEGGGDNAEGGGGLVEGATASMVEGLQVKMEMKPPISASIPKSRNHRRTPPTPPAHSPSPPALTSPPPALTTPVAALIDAHFAATATDKLPASHVMEISTPYGGPFVKKEVSSPPLGSPQLPPSSESELPEMANDAAIPDASFEQRLLQLKQQQQLQQQLLLHQYQQQQQQLTEQHQKQLQQHIKLQQNLLYHQFQQEHRRLLEQHENELHSHLKQYLEQQSKREEEREKLRKEAERLEALKNKEKSEQSANASSEVKQRLQEVILKKQRDAAATGAAAGPGGGAAGGGTSLRTWPPGSDFPLRKTASEPNICLKVRHKQRMGTERRPSPLVPRRKEKQPGSLKRRPPYAVESGSTPESGQSSPPNGHPTPRSSTGSTPIHEEDGGSPYSAHGGGGQGSFSDLSVYSSLPNISMGRPPHSTQPEGLKLPIVSEADMRTLPPHVGMPLTGHPLSSTLPYYPPLPVVDGEGYSMGGAPRGQQVTAMETSSGRGIMRGDIYHPSATSAITDPQRRTSRTRPLGRTFSSPLPLGHPMLQGQQPSFPPHAPPTVPHQHTLDHHLVKQQIRHSVLTRATSKNQVENVAEETEAAVAKAIATDKTPEEPLEPVVSYGPLGINPLDPTPAGPVCRQPWLKTLAGVTLTDGGKRVIDLTERKIEESQLARHHREHLLFPHHRDLTAKPPPLHSPNSAFTPRSGNHTARRLSRALSSPLVTLSPQGSPQEQIISKQGATTGLAYDNTMLKHQCICGDNSHHPEHAGRLHSIMARLEETGLIHRCYCVQTRKATPEEIKSCHSEAHTALFGTNPLNRTRLDMSLFADLPIKSFVRLHCGGIGVDLDTTWNEIHTSSAARMAAGCVIDLSFKVATGELRNGFALVRPPGHHAEHQQAMGFCFFNSVAIAARQLHQKLNLEKILIVDWDVHHGNGTQSMFYDDPHILYISMHRYDDGSFFPGTGAPTEVGEGDGYGFNVNIAFSGGLKPPMGDAEYLAAFRSVVMPIAKDFNPDVVLVSAGFDAADGHPSPLGGYKVSASCFAQMTKQLMTLARGKVVLALEGGYDLTSISDASQACVRALIGEDLPPISEQELTRPPCQNALRTLQNVIAVQSGPWPVVRRQSALLGFSQAEAQGREEEQETVSAMASLRVDPQNPQSRSPEPSPQTTVPGTSNDEEEPMEEDSEVK